MQKIDFSNIVSLLRQKAKEVWHFLKSGQIEFTCPKCEQKNRQAYIDDMDRVYCNHCGVSLVFGRDLHRIPKY